MIDPKYHSWVSNCFTRYNLYVRCRNLGIKLDPNEIDIKTLETLSMMSTTIADIQEKRRKLKQKRGK